MIRSASTAVSAVCFVVFGLGIARCSSFWLPGIGCSLAVYPE